jgi:two-component system, sensor histidine kinase LadS
MSITHFLRPCLGLALALVLCLTGPAIAQPLSGATPAPSALALPALQVGIVRDATPEAGVQDLLARRFDPVRLPFSRGATPAVSWLRLEVPPSPLREAVLLVQPQQLDDLRLYQAQPGGGWRLTQAGDRFAYAERERGDLYPAFNLALDPERPTVAYLRLQTRSAHILNLRLMTGAQASAWDSGLQFGMGLLLGAFMLLGLSSLVRWRVSRDSFWLAGAAFQLESVLFLGCFMGFAARYVWPHQPALADQATSVTAVLNLLCAAAFHWLMFWRLKAPRWALALQSLFVFAAIGALVLVGSGRVMQGLALNNSALALSALAGLVLMWFVRPSDGLLRRVIRASYLFTVIYAAYFALPILGLAPLGEMHLFPALPSIATVALTHFAIALRNDWLNRRLVAQTQQQMLETQIRLDNEQRQHARTAHFMSMLLHELKNPLAAIRLAAQSLRRMVDDTPDVAMRLYNIDRSVQGIDLVLERCRDLDQLDHAAVSVHQRRVDLHSLTRHWVEQTGQNERIGTEAPPPQTWVQADPMLLGLMVNNLLDNALKYSPPGTPVGLRVHTVASTGESAPTTLHIEVRNRVGQAGWPDPARLFQKYYRAEGAQHISGTGLGLSWVRGAAQQLQGSVHHAADGDHIVFTLWLPC